MAALSMYRVYTRISLTSKSKQNLSAYLYLVLRSQDVLTSPIWAVGVVAKSHLELQMNRPFSRVVNPGI